VDAYVDAILKDKRKEEDIDALIAACARYIWIYVGVSIYLSIYLYLYIHVCIYTCIHIYIYIHTWFVDTRTLTHTRSFSRADNLYSILCAFA
jgi:hypothetical protein